MKKVFFLLYKNLIATSIKLKLGKVPFIIPLHRFVYKLIKPKSVDVFGMKLFINPNDKVLSDAIIRDGIWEPEETKLITKSIRKGWTILDIGANIGYYTLLFSKLAGKKGKVYAFEPDPENFSILSKNVKENKLINVVLVNKAVSKFEGKLKLFLDEENKGDHKIYDSYDGRQSIRVSSTCLDHYFKNFRGKIDFIKMDIQGAEGLALMGMLNLLGKQNKITLFSEYWPVGLYKSGVDCQNYLRLLKNTEFSLFRLDKLTGKIIPLNEKKLNKDCTIKNKNYANLICIKSI